MDRDAELDKREWLEAMCRGVAASESTVAETGAFVKGFYQVLSGFDAQGLSAEMAFAVVDRDGAGEISFARFAQLIRRGAAGMEPAARSALVQEARARLDRGVTRTIHRDDFLRLCGMVKRAVEVPGGAVDDPLLPSRHTNVFEKGGLGDSDIRASLERSSPAVVEGSLRASWDAAV